MLTRPRLRRLTAAAVALSMAAGAVPVLSAAARAAPAAAPCDANGDGLVTGANQVVLSDGADAEAARLAAGAGYTLAPAPPAYRWLVPVCVETTPVVALSVTGPPTRELDPLAPAQEARARDRAIATLTPQLFRPGARTSPPVNGVQVIGVEMWLAVDPLAWVPFTATETDGEVSVTATATPARMVWEFTDGVTRTCAGPGAQYSPGAPGPAPCGRSFERTSDVVAVVASVRIGYDVAWSSTIATGGAVSLTGEPNRYELMVGEVQTYLTDGSRRAPAPPGALPLPKSTQPINDNNCKWSSLLSCSPSDIVAAVIDAAVDAALTLVGPEVRRAAEMVWAFLQGCAAYVVEAIGSIQDMFSQFAQLVSDPQGFLRDKLEMAREVYGAVNADGAGFAQEFLAGAIDMELLATDAPRWAGKIGCEIAIGMLTGAASARLARYLGDRSSFLGRLRDWRRGRDGGDGDGDVDLCPVSSFPTGTLVLMADGTRRPIEAVRPGDVVLAFDPGRAAWGPRPVEAQWSYLDTDRMATLRLAGGAALSSTDDHLFWNEDRQRFTEAAALLPGEHLATPGGPVAVGSVAVWPSGPTLVWELTVAVEHTFAVFAGDEALAVHNASCNMARYRTDRPDVGDLDWNDLSAADRRVLDEALGARRSAEAELRRLEAAQPPDQVAIARARNAMAQAGGRMGELAADASVRKMARDKGATATLRYPPSGAGSISKTGDFDLVYELKAADGSSEWVVVEAKGGLDPRLGSRQVKGATPEQQGTRKYYDEILVQMRKGTPEERAVAAQLAAQGDDVRYLLATTRIDATGGATRTAMSEFDLDTPPPPPPPP